MVVGADLDHGPDKVRFLADFFTRRSDMWYTSLRAMGYSMPAAEAGSSAGSLFGDDKSGAVVWSYDFNQWSLDGAPVRLDSGSRDIRVNHYIFERLMANMGDGRCRVNTEQAMECPCDPSTIASDFPWISLSFETYDNFRILGFDIGRDTRVCIPPSAYVFPSAVGEAGMCRLAIVDAGVYQKFFGLEGIVLGAPFFQSVTVGMDLDRHRLALGAPLYLGSLPAMSGGGVATGEAVQFEGSQSAAGMGTSSGSSSEKVHCACADPKNWWNTGRRYSPIRVVLVLVGTAATLLYVFVVHSDTAAGVRSQLDALTGGALAASPTPGNQGNQPAAPAARQNAGGPDRPFVEMTGPE
jgi:hypothetical protein